MKVSPLVYPLHGLLVRQIRVGRVCFDEGFVRKTCAEAEAGDEAIETVGVEKVSADREVLLEVRSLFLSERLVQFGLEVALFLRKLLHSAAGADAAFTRGYVSVVKVFQYVRHEVSSCVFLMVLGGKMRAGAVNT